MADKDCKVCEKLMKEKHRHDVVWKISCLIFLALAVVLAILYFGSGAVVTETHIELGDDSYIGNYVEGDGSIDGDNNIVVGSDNIHIDGTIERTDYTPIICITVIVAAALLAVGGTIIANHNQKNN